MHRLLGLFTIFLFFFNTHVAANEPISLRFYGYISHQVIYDSYRSLDTRDGEIYFYPLRANFDALGNDLNKKPKLNMVEVQSRFGMRTSEADILGGKLTGVLEADFLGTHQDYTRMLRIRLAYVNLAWERHQLLIGNAFHPTFVLECFPNTVGFAAAVPFHPLNRSPQIRYQYQPFNKMRLSLSLLTHGYHRSTGPAEAQKNSGLPDTQFHLQFGDGRNQALGFIAGYKFLTPRDITGSGISTSETIGSYNIQAYAKQVFKGWSLKTEVIYGQNLTNLLMIGGYGAKGLPGQIDLLGDYKYANMNTMSTWIDFETHGKPFGAGLFAGYTANLGSDHHYISLPGYSRNDDLHYVFRVSPRLQYQTGNLTFAFEWSVVGAAYGTEWDSRRKVITTDEPSINHHMIFATRYNF